MKTNIFFLKKIIREQVSICIKDLNSLKESRKSTNDLGDDYAVHIKGISSIEDGVIIPANLVVIKLLKGISSSEVGLILLEQAQDFDIDGYGVWIVKESYAQSGWGPFLYDLAMEVCGTIMSDREAVSSEAFNVWKTYQDGRPDITRSQLVYPEIAIPGFERPLPAEQLASKSFLSRWPLAGAYHRTDLDTPLLDSLIARKKINWDS